MKNIFDDIPEYSPEVLKSIEERYGNAEYKITKIVYKSPYSTLKTILTTPVINAEEQTQKLISKLLNNKLNTNDK